jgi:hypothetical protein
VDNELEHSFLAELDLSMVGLDTNTSQDYLGFGASVMATNVELLVFEAYFETVEHLSTELDILIQVCKMGSSLAVLFFFLLIKSELLVHFSLFFQFFFPGLFHFFNFLLLLLE